MRLTKSDSIMENIDIDVLILTRDRDNIASARYSYSAGVVVALLRPLWKLGEGVEGRHVSKPFKSSEEVYLDLICLAPNLLNLI